MRVALFATCFVDALFPDVDGPWWRFWSGSDPIAAYKRSGYFEKVTQERVGGEQAGWGA
jgi:hypothetical protein